MGERYFIVKLCKVISFLIIIFLNIVHAQEVNQSYEDDKEKAVKNKQPNLEYLEEIYKICDEAIISADINLLNKAAHLLDSIITHAPLTNLEKGLLHFEKGRIYLYLGEIVFAEEEYSNSLILIKNQNELIYGHCLQNIGWCFFMQAKFPQAISHFIDAQNVYISVENKYYINKTMLSISKVLIEIDELEYGKSLLDEYSINSDFNNLQVTDKIIYLETLGDYYIRINQLNNAKQSLNRALEIGLKSKADLSSLNVLNKLFLISIEEENLLKADSILTVSSGIDFFNKIHHIKLLYAKGLYYNLKGDNLRALHYLKQTEKKAKKHGYNIILKDVTKNLSSLNKLDGNFNEAVDYLEESLRLTEKLVDDSKETAIILLQQNKKSQHLSDSLKIVNLKNSHLDEIVKEKALNNKFKIGLLVLLSAVLIAIIIVLRVRKNILILRLNEKLKNEKLLSELYNSKMHSALIEIENYKDRIRYYTKISKQIKNSEIEWDEIKILTKLQWSEFIKLIHNTYPGLIFCIDDKFPDLTEGELRMLLLIGFKMSNDEISNAIGIANDSIRVTLFRLRKKYNFHSTYELKELLFSCIEKFGVNQSII